MTARTPAPGTALFRTTPAGYRKLLCWLQSYGSVDAVRALTVSQRSANKSRTQALDQLRAMVATAPAESAYGT